MATDTWRDLKDIVCILYKRGALNNQGSVHKEDASWKCENEQEATRLSKWLKDNHVSCKVFSDREWEALPKEYVE